jgi:hypothetical protein
LSTFQPPRKVREHQTTDQETLSWWSANAARSEVGLRVREGNWDFAAAQVLAPVPVVFLARPRDVDGLGFFLLLLLLLGRGLLGFKGQRSSCQEKSSYD